LSEVNRDLDLSSASWLRPARLRRAGIVAVTAALALAIFVADLSGRPGGIDASLYVVPIVMTLWLDGVVPTVVVAVLALGLGGLGLSFESNESWGSTGTAVHAGAEAVALLGATLTVLLRKRADRLAEAKGRGWTQIADKAPVLIRVANRDGVVSYANEGWGELLETPCDRLTGRVWDALGSSLPSTAREDAEAATNTACASETEFAVQRSDGRPSWVLERVTPRPAEGQGFSGFVGFGIDVTKRHVAEREVLEHRARLAYAERVADLGHAEVALVPTAKPVWSEGLYAILGLTPGSVAPSIQFFLSLVVPTDRDAVREAVRAAALEGEWRELTFWIHRADGRRRALRVNAQRIEGEEGRPARFFATLQDVTERLEMERSLREHRDSLAKAQEVANLGSWAYEPRTGRTFWSDQMTRIFGVRLAALPRGIESFVDGFVHPSDRDTFRSAWPKVLQERRPASSEYRVVRGDGRVRFIRAQCEYLEGGPDGEDVVIGTCQDVTETRSVETALRESEERFHLAARGANDGIWDWPDVGRDELWISPRYFELLGYDDGEFAPCGAFFNERLVHPDDVTRNLVAVQRHLEAQAPYDVEIRLRTKGGDYRWFQMRGQATHAPDGRPLRMAGSMQDVHDRKQAEAQVEAYQEQLRSLAYGVVVAAERERRRIGVELHDRTIQNLGLTAVKLAELRDRVAAGRHGPLVDEVQSLVKETIRDTRSLLAELGPPVLYELGFEAAVEWLAEQVGAGVGSPRIVVSSDAAAKPLGDGGQVVLFQAVRELLANVGKHAGASVATVSLRRDGDNLRVEVADDGVGFDPRYVRPPHVEHGGFGLFSIREGLRLLGGTIDIDSSAEKGTRVVLTAPLEKLESAALGNA
jgi:PAS domain S-box-containing protein